MPPVKLADTRLMTLDGAKQCLEQIAHAECRLASKAARYEKAIAAAKSRFEAETAGDRALIAEREQQLTAFILANRELFKSPRAVRTEFGEFGLRLANNKLAVADEAAAIQFALDNGYDDLVETVRTLLKDAVKKRLAAGEQIPGCQIPKGDMAFYKVARSLLEAARTLVEPASQE